MINIKNAICISIKFENVNESEIKLLRKEWEGYQILERKENTKLS